jgi:hypothetical protein
MWTTKRKMSLIHCMFQKVRGWNWKRSCKLSANSTCSGRRDSSQALPEVFKIPIGANPMASTTGKATPLMRTTVPHAFAWDNGVEGFIGDIWVSRVRPIRPSLRICWQNQRRRRRWRLIGSYDDSCLDVNIWGQFPNPNPNPNPWVRVRVKRQGARWIFLRTHQQCDFYSFMSAVSLLSAAFIMQSLGRSINVDCFPARDASLLHRNSVHPTIS